MRRPGGVDRLGLLLRFLGVLVLPLSDACPGPSAPVVGATRGRWCSLESTTRSSTVSDKGLLGNRREAKSSPQLISHGCRDFASGGGLSRPPPNSGLSKRVKVAKTQSCPWQRGVTIEQVVLHVSSRRIVVDIFLCSVLNFVRGFMILS